MPIFIVKPRQKAYSYVFAGFTFLNDVYIKEFSPQII